MANNKSNIDLIHDLLPKFLNSRTNQNWKALVEAIGQSDENLSDLIQEVRKQFFIKTSSRPYLDKLGANYKISRPRFLGMDDATFRSYVPVLAYQPKQVKLILDSLLDIFFFKDATTAFIQSTAAGPYDLKDGWELEYNIDSVYSEMIIFKASDFADISNASIDEVVSAINRTAKYSFAIKYSDHVQKKNFLRIFSNTVGAKGSITANGGRSNIAFKFNGYNIYSGSGADTVWNITKVGDTMTFEYTGGVYPVLNKIQKNDIVIITIPGNEGSFIVDEVNISNNFFTFKNVFGTPMTFDHSSDPDALVRFLTPDRSVIYKNNRRAAAWEVENGNIVIEMPASPPVVKRSLKGSAHINGYVNLITSAPTNTSIIIDDATEWPTSGKFVLQPLNAVHTHIKTISEDTTIIRTYNTRFNKDNVYTYTSKVGNTITGISPSLPEFASLHEISIVSAQRDTNNTVTVQTATPHGFNVNEVVCVRDTVGTVDVDPSINLVISINGSNKVLSTPTTTSFTYKSFGDEGEATGGIASVERIGMQASGSTVYLISSLTNTGILGPYAWDDSATYVLSSLNATIQDEILAGNNVRTLNISTNQIPNEEGYLIFDYGTANEEGPVRYLYKPTDNTIQINPAYVFQKNHQIGSYITMIRQRGSHTISTTGSEYAPYITDPAVAREVLKELMLQVKSVGIFMEFLIRYPEQIYATLDIYDTNNPDLWPL